MYKPAPVRPKKTSICRSRTGCKTCRQRRKKCDEKKPYCGLCKKLGRRCEQPSPTFEFRDIRVPSSRAEKHLKTGNPINAVTDPALDSTQARGHAIYAAVVHDDSVQPPGQYPQPDLQLSTNCALPLSTDSWALCLDLPSPEATNLDAQQILKPPAEADRPADTGGPIGSTGAGSTTTSRMLDLGTGVDTHLELRPGLLPRPNPDSAFSFYIQVWKDQCLPALHFSFNQFESLCGQSSLMLDLMATISACRLSRTLPQRRILRISDTPGSLFRPNATHECLSGEFYGSALRKMAWWSAQEFETQPLFGLTVLILFCYMESSMGHFQEFRLHSEGVGQLIESYRDRILPRGAGLVAAWVEVEMQNWWRRAYFSTPSYHGLSRPLAFPELGAEIGSACRALILWILCESHRLNTATIIKCWEFRNNNTENAYIDIGSTISDCTASMTSLSRKLNDWQASRPPTDLPLVERVEEEDSLLESAVFEVHPLHFSTHNSAMSFAYYVTARAIQCSGPLETLANASLEDVDDLYQETEDWVHMLLRVAAGISWTECIKRNVYTIGLSGLLLACAIRSRSLQTGLWIQEWLERRLSSDNFEEGNFPVFQILAAIRLVNRERINETDVFALFQTVNDGGGSGKFGSYHSQQITTLSVYGRCRATGHTISYLAPI